jgi:CBS domain-containing protein
MGERPPDAGEGLTVRDVMSPPAATATPDTPVGVLRRRLEQSGIRRLPVLDGELLVGIASYWDLLRAESDALPVRELMTRTVFVLAPDTPLATAARLVRERRLPVFPVLDGRKLVGMVSAADVLGPAEQPGS